MKHKHANKNESCTDCLMSNKLKVSTCCGAPRGIIIESMSRTKPPKTYCTNCKKPTLPRPNSTPELKVSKCKECENGKIPCSCPKGGVYETEGGARYLCPKCMATEWVDCPTCYTPTPKKERKIKAWAGFTDGEIYLRFDKEYDKQEYCIYKTKWRAKMDFDDVRPVEIIFTYN